MRTECGERRYPVSVFNLDGKKMTTGKKDLQTDNEGWSGLDIMFCLMAILAGARAFYHLFQGKYLFEDLLFFGAGVILVVWILSARVRKKNEDCT